MTKRIYYIIKPLLPRRLQLYIRRKVVSRQVPLYTDVWPIDEAAGKRPGGWTGWPEGKRFALILTHDVDTEKGQRRCRSLALLEIKMGFRSSFNFVPERYRISHKLLGYLARRGFEVGVHGLKHDGKLYSSRKTFIKRAGRINHYLGEWGAAGFRSPAMHHNLEWLRDLDIEYDASTFDTDPFEPQPEGAGTIFPFSVGGDDEGGGYVELPYTLPQDFTLFVLMGEKDLRVWKRKLDWIAARGGMALLNIHPDYMCFGGKPGIEEYPASYYEEFLTYVRSRYESFFWHAVPREVAKFIKQDFSQRRKNERI